MEMPQAAGPVGFSDEDIDNALDVLEDIAQWRLLPDKWVEVDRLVGLARSALAAGNRDGFLHATAGLELLSPVRITRVGATPTTPAPAPIRERANMLIHDLSRLPRPSTQSRDLAGDR